MAVSNNMNILNAVRSRMSTDYKANVPVATASNLNDVYSTILNNENTINALIPALTDLIIMQSVTSGIFENPLRGLKQNEMPFGLTEQEIFVNFAEGIAHNPRATCEDAFGIYEAYIMSAYHRINFNKDYPVTIWYDDIRTAFASEFGLKSLINAKSQAIISGASHDEYVNMIGLVESAYTAGACYPVHLSAAVNSEETGNELIKNIQTFVGHMAFPHREYNFAGSDAISMREDLIILTTPEVMASINVDTLEGAFNLDKKDLMARIVVTDGFPNQPGIQAALADRRFFKVRDQYRLMTTDRLNMPLRYNLVYHVKEMFSYSPFYPLIVFTTDSVDVTGLTVTISGDIGGSAVTQYTSGSQQEFYVNTTTTPNTAGTPRGLRYKITGNTSAMTMMVPGTNKLLVAADETGSLTITVTSAYKGTVTKAATLTKKA